MDASIPAASPSPKRARLEFDDSEHTDQATSQPAVEDDTENNCSICLQTTVDRTVLPACSHEFCYECILIWLEQSRRCPLCMQDAGKYIIHSIRSRYDYRKHFLPPLRVSPPPITVQARPNQSTIQLARRRRQEREWGRQDRENDESNRLERSIAKRRWIYRHHLYAKHVASNAYTKYRPYPTPAQFSASQDLISRTTTFLRRELQVWEGMDVEFLTNLIISLMRSIDIRSEAAVKLIAEFLDLDEPHSQDGRPVNAEHFAHEVYCYVRSPYKDLFVYDTVVQYDSPPDISPPPDIERGQRWRNPSPSSVHDRAPQENSENNRTFSSHSPERRTSERHTPVQVDRDALAPPSSVSRHGISSPDGCQETEAPISIARPTTDRKGKRRAVEVDVSEPSQNRDEAESHLGSGKSVLGRRTPISATPNEEFPRQGRSIHARNRTLVESIRAHLGENVAVDSLDPFAEGPSAGPFPPRQSSSRGGRGPPLAKSSEGICQGSYLSGGQGQIFTEGMSTDGLNLHSEAGVGGWLRTDPDSNNPMAKSRKFYIPRKNEPEVITPDDDSKPGVESGDAKPESMETRYAGTSSSALHDKPSRPLGVPSERDQISGHDVSHVCSSSRMASPSGDIPIETFCHAISASITHQSHPHATSMDDMRTRLLVRLEKERQKARSSIETSSDTPVDQNDPGRALLATPSAGLSRESLIVPSRGQMTLEQVGNRSEMVEDAGEAS